MHKKIIIALLLITVLNYSVEVEAFSADNIKIRDTISDSGDIYEIITINIVQNNKSNFTFSAPKDAHDIKINNNSYENGMITHIPLNCTECELTISYYIDDIVSKEDRYTYSLSRTLNFPDTPNNLIYEMQLPPGHIIDITETESDPNIVPLPTKLTTDGKDLIVVWEERNPELPKRYFIRYTLHPGFRTNRTYTIGTMLLLLGIISGILAKSYYDKNIRKQKNIMPKTIIPESLFSPDEKTVLKLLKENKTIESQKDIVKKLAWSKSKVSAIMTNLEYKKVIRREKFGRNYKIKVIKDVEGI